MVAIREELELERLRNLVAGFGWTVKKSEYLEDRLVVTLEKKREVPVTPIGPGPG